jgi:hypothetical protein
VPAWQAQGPEFKPQYHQKKKKRKKEKDKSIRNEVGGGPFSWQSIYPEWKISLHAPGKLQTKCWGGAAAE